MNQPTPNREQQPTIAVDLAKSTFHIAVSRAPGRVDEHHRVARARLLEFFARQPAATVVMEACGSAHHWARQFRLFGHRVELLPAQHVRKYRIGNKTDRSDTEAILEASRRAALRTVPVKSVEQQAIATLHRLRSGWLATRTARLNALRGALREFGVIVPLGAKRVLPAVSEALDSTAIPGSLGGAFAELCSEIRDLERRIATVERQLEALAQTMPVVERLRTVPGIGLLTSTALVAVIGDARRFPSGRHAASFLGLTPREHSSGDRRHLGAISKRGDVYLRMLLIHGARAVLAHAQRQQKPDRLRAWALRLQATRGHNRAAVALANRLARIAWAVWTKQRNFESQPVPEAA